MKSISYLTLVAYLTETPENLWLLDNENSQNDADITNLIFNHVDDSDCVTVQIIEGEVNIDSLRNDSLFDGTVDDAAQLYANCLQDLAA